MKKFKFSLQGVWVVRKNELSAREVELAKAREVLRLAEEKLLQASQRIDEATDLKRMPKSPVSSYFLQREKHLKSLRDQRLHCQKAVDEAHEGVRVAQDQLKLAMVEEKRIGKFYEQEKSLWLKEVKSEEQKISDEIGTNLALRKSLERD